jgi:hypothetical protein
MEPVMRPVLPATLRNHPTYTIDPNVDTNLRNAIAELLFNAQEKATVDLQLQALRRNGIRVPRKIPSNTFSGYPDDFSARLRHLRLNIAAVLSLPDTLANKKTKALFLFEMSKMYSKIWNKLATAMGVYTKAHHDLLATLGYYCSYCGIPVGIGVHVEHKLPKASYPNCSVNWDNFLLACDNCNAAKGEKPDRLLGYTLTNPPTNLPHLPLPGAGLLAMDETNVANGSRSAYLWPDDLTFTGVSDYTFELMQVTYTPNLYGIMQRTSQIPVSSAQLEPWVMNGQVKRLPPYNDKTVRGQFGGPTGPTYEVELHVRAVTSSTQPQATRVIDELHFNREQGDLRQSMISDLRVPLRTDAWFKAVLGIPRLIRAYMAVGGNVNQQSYQDLEDVWIESAMTSGFWLVWVKVINTYVSSQDQLRLRLLRRFVDPTIFPGTRSPFL